MQSDTSTISSFRRGYDERDRIESERYEEDRRRRRGMVIALVPLGIAMALIVNYTYIIVAIDAADWRYVLQRPNFAYILKLSLAPVIGGGFAMFFAGSTATTVFGREGRFFPLIMTAFLYAIFLPLLVGLLLPVNLFLLDITGLSLSGVSVSEAVSTWVWGTPFFVATYALTGVKSALWAGTGAVLLASAVFRYLGPNRATFSVGRTSIVTLAVAAAAVGLVMFGPLAIFEIIYNNFRSA